jgi:hypothetical protein
VPRAMAKVRSILDGHWPDHIPEEVDQKIREQLPIGLKREHMRPPA